MESLGIYVHIPFFVEKCNYCNFVSKYANEEEIKRYINFLCKEIEEKANSFKNKEVSSIYIGGGTPSYVNSKYIEKIMKIIQNNYKVKIDAEITIECNPCSTTKEKLQDYKKIGINRISFGVQSLNNDELKTIGRKHSSQEAINVILLAKEVGFENISSDLFIGIPEQTKKSLMNNINNLSNIGVTHISAYMLILEEGTTLCAQVNENMIIFDIGNEKAERDYPYYHILEDSPIIRKREKSDVKTRGSQATIKDKGKRDYSIISFNGKSFSKEYSKNIRGQRKQVIEKATYYINENGKRVARDENTKSSNSYVNKHYHYLENMAIKINPILADMFGIQYVGSRGTSLKDEYIMQEYGAIMSFDDMLAFNVEWGN